MKRRHKTNKSAAFLRSYEWKAKRIEILNRDCCQCVLCGCSTKPTVHHVLLRSTWPELALEEKNLVTLCPRCHSRFKLRFSAHGDPVAFWIMFEELRPEQAAFLKTIVFQKF